MNVILLIIAIAAVIAAVLYFKNNKKGPSKPDFNTYIAEVKWYGAPDWVEVSSHPGDKNAATSAAQQAHKLKQNQVRVRIDGTQTVVYSRN